jgi:beta-lactamase class A
MTQHILTTALQTHLNSIDGSIGVFAQHSEKGELFAHNNKKLFYLASTYKIPIAIQCLRMVDAGLIDLNQRIEVQAADVPEGSAILDHRHFSYPGVSLSVNNLIRLMIEYSDNTASDLILNLVGGIPAVRKFLAEFGYAEDISIDLSIAEAFAEEEFQEKTRNPESYTRDSGNPQAMAKLLHDINSRVFLSESATSFLLGCMQRCKTGNARIRALLPETAIVANKTGTLTGYVNDIAIIDLASGKKLFLAIFIRETSATTPQAEAVIANIAKVIFDHA